MNKLDGRWAIMQIAKRLLHPRHLFRMVSLARTPHRQRKAAADAQLQLYAQIFPEGHLNYGYFDDPAVAPEQISLGDIQRAQHRYAELIVEQILDHRSPVLDVGCGMGGLIRLLLDRGLSPTGLTPDQYQLQHLQKTFPNVPFLHSKFEEIPPEQFRHRFGTVINSESLQYIKLERAVPLVKALLTPGGRWIVADFFNIDATGKRAGHPWEAFAQQMDAHRLKIVQTRDITPHVLPTLAFFYHLGRQIGLPLTAFTVGKLAAKRPALHYLLDEVLTRGQAVLADRLETINPATFAKGKKYLLLVIEHG
jgi:SAM-dependent methyltransferase